MLHFKQTQHKQPPYGQSLPPIENYQINYVTKPITAKPKTSNQNRDHVRTDVPFSPILSDNDFIHSIMKNGGTPLAFAGDLENHETKEPPAPEPVVLIDKDFHYYKDVMEKMSAKDVLSFKTTGAEEYINKTFQIQDPELNKQVIKRFTLNIVYFRLKDLVDNSVMSHMAYCL